MTRRATAAQLTPSMRRELAHIAKYGRPSDLEDWGANALAFYTRDKVIGALMARGLIEDSEHATAAGMEALQR